LRAGNFRSRHLCPFACSAITSSPQSNIALYLRSERFACCGLQRRSSTVECQLAPRHTTERNRTARSACVYVNSMQDMLIFGLRTGADVWIARKVKFALLVPGCGGGHHGWDRSVRI
jgi:hypothetical protein